MIFSPVKWYQAWRSETFFAGLRLWLVMLVSNLVLLLLVSSFFSHQFFLELRDGFHNEVRMLSSLYKTQGIAELKNYTEGGHVNGVPRQFSYIVLDSNNRKLAGNLDELKVSFDVDGGWIEFLINVRSLERSTDTEVEFIASDAILHDGSHLQIVRYVGASRQMMRSLVRTLSIGILLSLGLSLFVISRGSADFLSRLEPINRDIDIVMSGDLTHRLEAGELKTELDRLARHINDMLDRIQELMDGVKLVSDNIAHDLRTPLTRLRNDLALYERDCDVEDQPVIRSLIEEADQLISTFNALLRIARIELSDTRREWLSIEFDALVGEVVDLYEPVAAEKNIAITADLGECKIAGDRDLIFQAVANVLDNAIKYTPFAGKIEIALQQNYDAENDENLVTLTIRDTGCGIEEKNIPKVFRRFYREDSSRGKEPGNGLGLSLVAAVVKVHRATITLQNTWPGLQVTLNFPVSVAG